MAKDMQYVGFADVKTVTGAEFTAAGVVGQGTATWQKSNNYRVNVSDTAAAWLLAAFSGSFQEVSAGQSFQNLWDGQGTGVDLMTKTALLRTDFATGPYPDDDLYIPVIHGGVLKRWAAVKMFTGGPQNIVTVTANYTWVPGVGFIWCNNGGAINVTLPAAADPGHGQHMEVMVARLAAGVPTLVAGASATINKQASKPLTVGPQQNAVAKFRNYFQLAGSTFYVAWGDLG